ncbi:MAG: FAD binding domain-containing protein [Lacisediminihabitans sp.]
MRETRVAHSRDDLVFAPGEQPLGGGTWLFSEEQDGLTGLVDLTTMGWTSITETDAAVTIAATCTIADLADLTPAALRSDPLAGGRDRTVGDARALFWQCANSLLASFKIWNVATVGGNIATALPAGPMTSLASALDATAIVWTADDRELRLPVTDLVTGVRQTALAPGEVLRAIEIPRVSLESHTGFRRIALSPLGRTGTLVIARASAVSPEVVLTVTGGTTRPVQLRFDGVPSAAELERAMLGVDSWYTDPHGAADWRRAMSALFAEELRAELA